MSTKKKADGYSRVTGKSRTTKSGRYKTDSEKDSGFSDASSEHRSALEPTDSEGSPCARMKRPSQHLGSGSKPAQLAVMGASYPSLSPMIIMNNNVLKQPGDAPPALKPWGFSPTVEVVQPVGQQPQVVFLQPVVSNHSPPVAKDGSVKRRRPKRYLPILKSYPKIAPHPGDSSTSSGRGSLSNLSSSSGSERGRSSSSSHRERRHDKQQQQQQRCLPGSGSSSLPAPPSPSPSPSPQRRLSVPLTDSACSTPARDWLTTAVSGSEFTSSPSVTPSILSEDSYSQPPSVLLADTDHEDGGNHKGQKRKRFCNTYNILSKSGLLDITLRTKELIRQNRRSQSDLDCLKEDMSRFLLALSSGDASVCDGLFVSLQEKDGGKDGSKEKGSGVQRSYESD